MASRWRFVRKEILPKPGVLAMMGIALGLTLIGILCSLLFALTKVENSPEAAAGLFACFLMPVILILLFAATFRDKRPLPRALLWSLMALLSALAALIFSLAMSTEPELGVSGSLLLLLVFGAPVVLLLFAPAIYYAAKGWRGLQATLYEERLSLADARIRAAQPLDLARLAGELALDAADTAAFLERAIGEGRIAGYVDRVAGRVYSNEVLSARRLDLLGVLKAHGQIALGALAEKLDAPQPLITEWIYDLVQHGRFSGYINWDKNMLYSAERAKLGGSERCPNCGGRMELAGKGIVSCSHCGAEILL